MKRARDSVSSLVAQVVHTIPVLQRPYAVAAFACSRVPGVHTVFREATRQLSRQMRDANQNIRPVRVGDLRMLDYRVSILDRIPGGVPNLLFEVAS
jgi:hypothetical protein